MSVNITIRDVPDEVRDELATRAAQQHKSMQQYLREELERLTSRPSVDRWLAEVRERKAGTGSEIGTEAILAHRDADRR